jgi:hypothetical protein
MLGQQTEGKEVVGFAASHRLGKLEYPLGRPSLQPSKTLSEQYPHALGEMVFIKEIPCIDAAFDQITEVQDRIAPSLIK